MIISQKEYTYKGTKKNSRKGVYTVIKYKDDKGKIRTSQLKKGNLNEKETKLYINRISNTNKNSKQSKKEYHLVKETLRAKKQKELKAKRTAKPESVKRNSKQSYLIKKETTTNQLLDRNHRLTQDGYAQSGKRIIMALQNNYSDINNMNVETFRNTLTDYMKGNSGYANISGIKKTFIEDVVNKWASEVKKWD